MRKRRAVISSALGLRIMCALPPCFLVATALVTIALPTAATARSPVLKFDVPAQDLASALQQLARQAGVQLLFPFADAVGKPSKPIRGEMTVRQAVERLIAGHRLEIVSDSGTLIVLKRMPRQARRTRISKARPRLGPEPSSPTQLPSSTPASNIIVTGRAVTSAIGSSDYSFAVTSIDRLDLDRNAPVSTAELFRLVPGFWVESSGGQGSNNVRARGIPTDGYSSIALAENGLPVQYDGSLAYLNTDQSYRLDDTIERIEVVRGGPSSIFMPNAPGGIANMILRSGLADPGGRLKLQLGDHGYGRFDGVLATRISPELGLLIGGFYRVDGGRRRPGYTADSGGQFRVGLDYHSGPVNVAADWRHIDDRVTFYLPVPFRSGAQGKIVPIVGFDPLYDSLSGPETEHVTIRNVGAPTSFDLTQGTRTRLDALTLRAKLALSDGMAVTSAVRWRKSATLRNALFPIGSPMTEAAYLDQIRPQMLVAFPQTAALSLRYTDTQAPMPADANGNGLVLGANLMTVSVPLEELISDSRWSYAFDGLGSHNFALGITLAHYSFCFDRYAGTILLDVRNHARLVDAVVLDSKGQTIGSYTDHGFQRYGSLFDQVGMGVDAQALYGSDEWQIAPRFRLDLGARWERNRIGGQAATKTTIDLGDSFTLADNQVMRATGAHIPIARDLSALGWTLGLAYQATTNLGIFARYTSTFRLPSAGDFSGDPNRTDLATVPIKLLEGGVKLVGRRTTLNATGFYTRYERLPFTDYRFDQMTNAYVERTAIGATVSYGFEVAAKLHPLAFIDLSFDTTWQRSQYRDFRFTDISGSIPRTVDFSGDQLIRIPALSLRGTLGFHVLRDRLRAQLTTQFFTKRYADIANTQVLPSYGLVGFDLLYRPAPHWQFGLHVTNLTNSIGLTEGNPRSGSFYSGGSTKTYFFARPEFARSVRVGIAWSW